MNLADLSIRRPVFITALVSIMIATGFFSMQKLGVDLFPDISFPFVAVTTIYPGAGPSEIETLVSKPLEDELSTLSGLKRLSSYSMEGVSRVFAEFTMETDVKYAEQQIRDRVGGAKRKLPTDAKEPIIRRLDPSDQPVLLLSVRADLPEAKLYDVAENEIKPRLEQVPQVGLVEIIGGRKREIRVALDRNKLKARELSVTSVASRLAASGENVPVGKAEQGKTETVFRSIGEFRNLTDIKNTLVNFFGSDVPTSIGDIGTVEDTLADETSRAFVNGKKALILYAFRQSGANTIAVVDALKARAAALNKELANFPGKPQVDVVRDGAVPIRANVDDVKESILIGIVLAVLVVYLFLANGRSTIITGLALPNSLIGAFVLMAAAGFSVNVMTLLALSLSVGLLIDDAIVVRENIFRHIEMGKSPIEAAREGTKEVQLAVIATTLTVIAVFGPVAFLSGIVGQFFKQFGLTICFAMAISLFDALTVAPMLSAYFAGGKHTNEGKSLWKRSMGRILTSFERFQSWLERQYETLLRYTIRRPLLVLGTAGLVFLGSCATIVGVPKTFMATADMGELSIGLDLPPGTSLETTGKSAAAIDEAIRSNPEVQLTALTVGGRNGESNVAEVYVHLVPAKSRSVNTTGMKEKFREQMKAFAFANPKVKDYDPMGFGMRPFTLDIMGNEQAELERAGHQMLAFLKKHPGIQDPDIDFRPGKPELQVTLDPARARELGISTKLMGGELRAQIEGITPAKLREKGVEYDVRVRLREDQRNLKESFSKTYVPNMNMNLVRLADAAKPVETQGLANINRQNRSRFIRLSGDIAPGAGLGNIMQDVEKAMKDGTVKLPPGFRYAFVGQAESFGELMTNMLIAVLFSTLFIYLVLASLYESFVTPFTIMLALPLAVCGCFVALFVTGESLNIFSMIGAIMLLGVATKNSILLVDYANQQLAKGVDRTTAMVEAGKTRLRPILMTTMALIAGTLPVALGLNEASRQRTSMGVAIIGGLISSTLLTLVVVPAAYAYIDRFRVWSRDKLRSLVGAKTISAEASTVDDGPAPALE